MVSIHIYLNVCVCGISCVKLYKQKYLYHLIFLKSLVRKVSFPLCSGKSTRHVIGRSWVWVTTRISYFPSEKISIVSAVRKSSCFLWRAPFRVLTFTKKIHVPSFSAFGRRLQAGIWGQPPYKWRIHIGRIELRLHSRMCDHRRGGKWKALLFVSIRYVPMKPFWKSTELHFISTFFVHWRFC